MWALKLLLIPLLIYVAILVAIYVAQTSLIFPANAVQGAGPLPPGAERLELATADGERLHGVHLRPRASPIAPVMLVFPGNAWNAEDAALFIGGVYPGADIVAFHYRGYRPSTGTPGAAALLADAPLVHDSVAKRFPGRPIVAIGLSIGSGPAAHMAGERPLAGLILVTPFDSLGEVAAGHYPWLPARLLLRHRMNPAEVLGRSDVPTALIVAARDTLIPPRRAEALAGSVRNLVFKRTIEGVGHNDIYPEPAFAAAMAAALARLGGHPRA